MATSANVLGSLSGISADIAYPKLGYAWCTGTVAQVVDLADSAAQDALCALLRDLRRNAGLRQVDLAKALGQPQSFISKYESGERRLDVLEVRVICHALETSFAQFAELLEQQLDGA